MADTGERIALVVVDNQNGFHERRDDMPGTGELPVPDSHAIIEPLNELTEAFVEAGHDVILSGDQHPKPRRKFGRVIMTAHFSDHPDFNKSWPIHCVVGTPGAEFHRKAIIPENAIIIDKGTEVLQPGEFDTSYTIGSGHVHGTHQPTMDMLRERNIGVAVIGGLTTDYCVLASAVSSADAGIRTIVAIDATRAVTPDGHARALATFAEHGIEVATTRQILARLAVGQL